MSFRYKGAVLSTVPPTTTQYVAPGLWTLQQQFQGQGGSTWPLFSDPYYEYVSLLLTGDGTNGAQNNTFLDSSTNNFTITRNGNTTQGSFSPYGNLWSNYFGTANGNAFSMSGTITLSGDFTIEAWLNMPTASSSGYSILFSSTSATQVGLIATDGRIGYFDTSVGVNWTATNTFLFNQWNHVAWVRNSGTVTIYLNGVSVLTVNSSSASITVNRIGGYSTGSTTYNVYGYMSNARITNTAVYTTAFTPSTAPLTAISGTQLLTCQSNRFIDNSSNAYTLTQIGSPSVQRFSPFNPTAPYSASTIGGSGYFDGSGDKITAPSSTAFNFGTGDFTIEMWAYANATIPTYPNAFFLMDARTSASWYVFLASNALYFGDSAGTEYNGGSLVPFAWNHLVVSRVSGTTKGFVNGVQAFSFSDSGNYTGSPVVTIGGRYTLTTYDLNGYMSDVRIVKGSGVSSVTVPTSPLTAITNTQLLCNFTNAGIPDAAMMNDLETVGNAQVSTSVKKYGTGSLAFDGTGDWLTMPVTYNLGFGTGNFTIEGWINVSSIDSTYRAIFSIGGPVQIYSRNGTIEVYFNDSDDIVSYIVSGMTGPASSISANTWAHIAVVRNGTTFTAYVNGVAGTSVTGVSAAVALSASGAQVGAIAGVYPFTGYIDDLRITKGYARYTANFTPPGAPVPTY